MHKLKNKILQKKYFGKVIKTKSAKQTIDQYIRKFMKFFLKNRFKRRKKIIF